MNKNTTKRVKVLGTQTYINANTGEIQEMAVTSIEDRDFNFTKVWMKSFISTLEIVGNQKTKLCFWIIDHIDRENKLCFTYRQMAEACNISLETVRTTMSILLDADFLRKRNQGVYVINPNMVFKGSKDNRMNVLTQYCSSEVIKLTKEEKIRNIQKSIEAMQHQLEQLMADEEEVK